MICVVWFGLGVIVGYVLAKYVLIPRACPYKNKCDLYDSSGFVCNKEPSRYCGKFKEFEG